MRELQIPERYNAAVEFVDKNVEAGRGEKVAIYYQDKTFTYRQLLEMVNRCGNFLKRLGVEIENRVMVLLPDSPEFAAAFFGAMKIGGVPIPVNTLLKASEYGYMLNDSRAKVLVIAESLLDELEKARGQLRYLKHIVVVGEPRPEQFSFSELMAEASPALEPAETGKDDSAFWLYSSGSTGPPKGAVHLHHDMLYCAEYYAKGVLGIRGDDITFSASKLFHAYGLGNALYFPFSVGASTVFYPGRPLPRKVFEVIESYRPTIFFGVPTLYAALLQEEVTPDVLRSLRACVSAGESLPAEIFHRWKQKFNLEILDGIGTTEMLHIFVSNRPGEIRPGSSGKVVPGYEVKIVDETGREVGTGEIGDLLVKGDSAAAYYWNKHEKTKRTMLGEWLATGDKYYRDEDGFLWYCGRSDDMFKVGGLWVSPAEVEAALIEHPAVLESAVVAVTDKDGLVKSKAFIVLKKGQNPGQELAADVQTFVKGKLAPYKYPRLIEFVDELPKTATGKIQRFVLRSREPEMKIEGHA